MTGDDTTTGTALPDLPATLPAGSLDRCGLDSCIGLHQEIEEALQRVEPGHGNVKLRLNLTKELASAYLLGAQRTTTGWELTELLGVEYSFVTRDIKARVEIEVSY